MPQKKEQLTLTEPVFGWVSQGLGGGGREGPVQLGLKNLDSLHWLETLKSNKESTHLSWVECVRDVSIWSNFGPSCWSPLYHHSKAPSLISDGYLLTTLGG